jgi:hypothetical protein
MKRVIASCMARSLTKVKTGKPEAQDCWASGTCIIGPQGSASRPQTSVQGRAPGLDEPIHKVSFLFGKIDRSARGFDRLLPAHRSLCIYSPSRIRCSGRINPIPLNSDNAAWRCGALASADLQASVLFRRAANSGSECRPIAPPACLQF